MKLIPEAAAAAAARDREDSLEGAPEVAAARDREGSLEGAPEALLEEHGLKLGFERQSNTYSPRCS
jgi:hypothetical protein